MDVCFAFAFAEICTPITEGILEWWIKSYLSGLHATLIIIPVMKVIFDFDHSFVWFKMELHTCQPTFKWRLHKSEHQHGKRNVSPQLIHLTLLHIQTDN